MTAVLIALAALAVAVPAARLLPLVWPDRAYLAEMARRDAAAIELLTHLEDEQD